MTDASSISASQEWIDDCMKWRGKVLTGKYAHWCYDWDDLPVDESTDEWESCTCFPHPDQMR